VKPTGAQRQLVGQWLRAGVMKNGSVRPVAGTPRGGVISLLANVYVHAFDCAMARAHTRLGRVVLVRYADDFVVIAARRHRGGRHLAPAGSIPADLGVQLHPDRTRIVDLREGREGFDLLRCHFHARMWGRLWEQNRVIRYYRLLSVAPVGWDGVPRRRRR
jgi:RNA-directed DNA polymerase